MKSVQKINETTQDRILEMDLSAELKHGVVVSNLAYDVAKNTFQNIIGISLVLQDLIT